MDYQALETEIKDRLISYFAATDLTPGIKLDTVFEARIMPENDKQFTRTGQKAIANVHYSSSNYESPKGTNQISQDETITISVYLQFRELRGNNGGMNLMKHVKLCLLGFRPTNARTRMHIGEEGDWTRGNEDEGMQKFIDFKFTTITQQLDDAPAPMGGVLNGTQSNPAVKTTPAT